MTVFRKRKDLLFLVFICLTTAGNICSQQQIPADWKEFNFIIGEWIGEGGGAPGEAVGSSTFYFDLQKTVLIRKSFADYPAANNNPAFRHDDLMIIYREGKFIKAIYFDNERHVINYSASLSEDLKTITFVSDINPAAPRFRLIYTKRDENTMSISFEFAPPGKPDEFSKYLDGVVKKKI